MENGDKEVDVDVVVIYFAHIEQLSSSRLTHLITDSHRYRCALLLDG